MEGQQDIQGRVGLEQNRRPGCVRVAGWAAVGGLFQEQQTARVRQVALGKWRRVSRTVARRNYARRRPDYAQWGHNDSVLGRGLAQGRVRV